MKIEKEQQSVPRAKTAQPVCVISIIREGEGQHLPTTKQTDTHTRTHTHTAVWITTIQRNDSQWALINSALPTYPEAPIFVSTLHLTCASRPMIEEGKAEPSAIKAGRHADMMSKCAIWLC